jgi:hypothetical protein
MKALVVYESMFGNTQKVAEAVAAGLRHHMEVQLRPVNRAPAPQLGVVDLVVVGGPTHAFSMTRESTRGDAVKQGAVAPDVSTGIREWIDRLHPGPHSEVLATFDTRVAKVRHLPGSAAKAAAKHLHKLGYRSVVKPESFLVRDTTGPLLPGEIERARAWGDSLAVAMEVQTQAT